VPARAMLAPMQPETGGRFAARLLGKDAVGARFRIDLATPLASWTSEALVLAADGVVHFSGWTGPDALPAWLEHYARSALRTAWRQHALQGWPRRITRWRAEPEPGRDPGRDAAEE
jgi:hypothetical protein